MNKQWQKNIDEVMDWFDFDKVAKTMATLNWSWWDEGVPSEGQLRRKARQLMTECVERGRGVATGGFKVELDIPHNGITLEFIVSDWSAWDE